MEQLIIKPLLRILGPVMVEQQQNPHRVVHQTVHQILHQLRILWLVMVEQQQNPHRVVHQNKQGGILNPSKTH